MFWLILDIMWLFVVCIGYRLLDTALMGKEKIIIVLYYTVALIRIVTTSPKKEKNDISVASDSQSNSHYCGDGLLTASIKEIFIIFLLLENSCGGFFFLPLISSNPRPIL